MPNAGSGIILVAATTAAGAAMAILGLPDSRGFDRRASMITLPKPPSRVASISAVVLIFQEVQPKGDSSSGALQQFLPAAAPTVALVALIWGVFQYLRDRKRERGLRVEEGIAGSTDKLTAFPGTSDAGVGSVVAALRNLREFVSRSEDPATIETEVAEILATVAREDLDYRDPRHVRFDILCLQYWKGYRVYQAKNLRENLYILDKYIGALAGLDGKTDLVTSVRFGESGMENIPPVATDSDIHLLTRLTEGYGIRLALLPLLEAREAEQHFLKAAGGNKSLREKMLSARTREVDSHASAG